MTANPGGDTQRYVGRTLFLRSLAISSAVTLVTVALAYPMAYFVAFRVARAKFVWLLLLTIPFWTSYLLRVFAWKVILGYNGVINSALIGLGLISQPLEFLLYNPTAVVVTMAHPKTGCAPCSAFECTMSTMSMLPRFTPACPRREVMPPEKRSLPPRSYRNV